MTLDVYDGLTGKYSVRPCKSRSRSRVFFQDPENRRLKHPDPFSTGGEQYCMRTQGMARIMSSGI